VCDYGVSAVVLAMGEEMTFFLLCLSEFSWGNTEQVAVLSTLGGVCFLWLLWVASNHKKLIPCVSGSEVPSQGVGGAMPSPQV
jgi:hypothetical protein